MKINKSQPTIKVDIKRRGFIKALAITSGSGISLKANAAAEGSLPSIISLLLDEELSGMDCAAVLEGEGPGTGGVPNGPIQPDNTRVLSEGTTIISNFYNTFRPDFSGSGDSERFGIAGIQAQLSSAIVQDVVLTAEVIDGDVLTVVNPNQTVSSSALGLAEFSKVFFTPNDFGPSDTDVTQNHTVRVTISSAGHERCVYDITLDLADQLTASVVLEGEGPSDGPRYPANSQTLISGINTISDFYTLFRPDYERRPGVPIEGLGSIDVQLTPAVEQEVSLEVTRLSGTQVNLTPVSQSGNTDASGMVSFDGIEFTPSDFGPASVNEDHTFRLTFSTSDALDVVFDIVIPFSTSAVTV